MVVKMVLAKRRATPNATLRPITADSKSVTGKLKRNDSCFNNAIKVKEDIL